MADIITCLCLISNLYPVVISHTSGDNMTLILCFWSGRLLPLTPVPSLAFHYSPPALCPPLCLQISLLWTLASTHQLALSRAWPSPEVCYISLRSFYSFFFMCLCFPSFILSFFDVLSSLTFFIQDMAAHSCNLLLFSVNLLYFSLLSSSLSCLVSSYYAFDA